MNKPPHTGGKGGRYFLMREGGRATVPLLIDVSMLFGVFLTRMWNLQSQSNNESPQSASIQTRLIDVISAMQTHLKADKSEFFDRRKM